MNQYKESVQWTNTMNQYNEPIQWTNTTNQYNEPIQWINTMNQYNEPIQWTNTMNQYKESVQWTHTMNQYNVRMSQCTHEPMNQWTIMNSHPFIRHYTQRCRDRDRGRGKGNESNQWTLALDTYISQLHCTHNWFRKSLHRFAVLNFKSPFC